MFPTVIDYEDSHAFIGKKNTGYCGKEELVKRKDGYADIELTTPEIALYWFDPGRAYDPMIGRWHSVDPKLFPSWSPYHFALNNPLRIFDPDGQSGVDVSRAAYNIHQKNYWYFWGGKHPNDNMIALFNNDHGRIKELSLLHYRTFTLRRIGIMDMDLGYDCSGFVAAINDANPDASFSFAGKNAEGIYGLMNKHMEYYDKITDADKLVEGDFLIRNDKKHIVALVRDPKTGKLVIAEAPSSGKKVGLKLGKDGADRKDDIFDMVKSGAYVGFHDRGNDPKKDHFTKTKRDKTRGDSFSGWGAEYGSPPW